MEYQNIYKKPNIIEWHYLPRPVINGLTTKFSEFINNSWNQCNGIRVLASFLGYIEHMPKNITAFGTIPNKGFKCRNINGEIIEVEIGFNEQDGYTVTIKKDDIIKTFQCLNSTETRALLINLISFGYNCNNTNISRFLLPNIFQVCFDRKQEHLEVFMEDIYDKSGKHFILHDEETVFKNISGLKSLYDIPEICARLYHNNGQQILDNIIELSNYDENDLSNMKDGFIAKVQNCKLIHYQERKLIRSHRFATVVANLINGEYNFDCKLLGFNDEEKDVVREEIEAYMAEKKIQVNELSEGLKKKLS